MELYLVRHGIAEEPGAAIEDSDRHLTEEGREKTDRIAKALRKRVERVDVIFHSPYARAVETARIFAKHYPHAKLTMANGLTPHDSARAAMPLLGGLGNGEAVMIVGHEPHLSALASYLLTGRDKAVLEFKKSGVAGIDCLGSLQHCRLSFFISPKWL